MSSDQNPIDPERSAPTYGASMCGITEAQSQHLLAQSTGGSAGTLSNNPDPLAGSKLRENSTQLLNAMRRHGLA